MIRSCSSGSTLQQTRAVLKATKSISPEITYQTRIGRLVWQIPSVPDHASMLELAHHPLMMTAKEELTCPNNSSTALRYQCFHRHRPRHLHQVCLPQLFRLHFHTSPLLLLLNRVMDAALSTLKFVRLRLQVGALKAS